MIFNSRSESVRLPVCVLSMLLCGFGISARSQDVRNSSDHPLFPNRMPGYTISNYQQQAFSSYQFRSRPSQVIEGKYTRIHYYLKNTQQHPGGTAIRRNYENAILSAGGMVVHSDKNVSVLKVKREGVEAWAEIQASTTNAGRYYFLHIVERTPMEQVITADAMAASIEKDGFVALDIHFATGKSDILPESQPLIKEIVAMLAKSQSLRVGVEGHTDNTGTPDGNKKLSGARAQSVVAALNAAGISRERLEPIGHGQDRSIADNRTEEGRAKNRRVEIVKR